MKKKSESGTARNHRASRKQVTGSKSSGKRKTKDTSGGKAADWIDLDAELRRAKRDFARNKSQVDAGETFASGYRSGREGAPSSAGTQLRERRTRKR